MITINTEIDDSKFTLKEVKKACEALMRDIKNTCLDTDKKGIMIVLKKDETIKANSREENNNRTNEW